MKKEEEVNYEAQGKVWEEELKKESGNKGREIIIRDEKKGRRGWHSIHCSDENI